MELQENMERNNMFKIVGHITEPPKLIIDAESWRQKIYETGLRRIRPSGREDTYVLRFSGESVGSEEMLNLIQSGVKIMICGEIRSENVHNIRSEENSVKVYLYAEVISVGDQSVDDKNEAWIRGRICRQPYFKISKHGKRMAIASILVGVNTPKSTSYIPCVCWGLEACQAKELKVGDSIEICGYFQARTFKKWMKGQELPLMCTTHEISVVKMKIGNRKK